VRQSTFFASGLCPDCVVLPRTDDSSPTLVRNASLDVTRNPGGLCGTTKGKRKKDHACGRQFHTVSHSKLRAFPPSTKESEWNKPADHRHRAGGESDSEIRFGAVEAGNNLYLRLAETPPQNKKRQRNPSGEISAIRCASPRPPRLRLHRSQSIPGMSDSPITHQGQVHQNSVTGSARNPFASGKLFGVRQTIAPPATRDLPTTLPTKSRFTLSPASGSSVHFASNSSRRPPVSTTKSTSRVRSR
jgi:hypothetical protein